MIERRGSWGLARSRAEDRRSEILSSLAEGEAFGTKGDGTPRGWELEEELLDELEELERALSRVEGDDGPRSRTSTQGTARRMEDLA